MSSKLLKLYDNSSAAAPIFPEEPFINIHSSSFITGSIKPGTQKSKPSRYDRVIKLDKEDTKNSDNSIIRCGITTRDKNKKVITYEDSIPGKFKLSCSKDISSILELSSDFCLLNRGEISFSENAQFYDSNSFILNDEYSNINIGHLFKCLKDDELPK